ncbi:hypothetical protein E3N88_31705 [Mikania micrantha]|uniref:Aminotransferase-like plant mobile domain-containing protein n=1 Tax=Mikania micrantha TaxID=192012 RepID=A0A5N6M6Y9_9ASTR|nr:hypothetical protein E3N88_31705 [Mikania micrantha]
MERLPFICRSGEASWTCKCFLILWEVVEPHHSSRVMRQFGLLQNIPNPIPLTMDQHHTIHNLNRGGKLNKDWLRHHQQYVSSWNQRLTNTIDGQHVPAPTVSDDYMRWYRSHTVLYITNPGSEEVNPRGFQNDGGAYQLMDTVSQVMGLAHEGHRLEFPTHLTTQSVNSMAMRMYPKLFVDVVGDVIHVVPAETTKIRPMKQDRLALKISKQAHLAFKILNVTPNVVPTYGQQSSFDYFAEDLSMYEQPRYSDVSQIPLNLSLGMMPSQEDVNENNQRRRRQTRPPPCGTGHRLSRHDH